MKKWMLVISFATALLIAPRATAQDALQPPSPQAVQSKVDETRAIKAKIEEAQQNNPRFVRTLTNVQIELTLTDQLGGSPAEKKTVSMIAASGSWGKIRSAGNVRPVNQAPLVVDLNVDARPFVTTDGLIQLELTLNYTPPGSAPKEKEDFTTGRPTGVNQSQTVILTSGKPLVISQAADPISDRKVIVEVKATVLK